MKKLSLLLLVIFLASAGSTSVDAKGNSADLSGTVSYTGATTGPIFVAAFTDPTFSGEPTYYVELSSPGSYTLPGLHDGTYYVISTMATGDDGDVMITDPWGVYVSLENPTPVTITGGIGESGIDITLVDVTEETPNPFGEEPYSVSAISGNSSDGERYNVGFSVKDPDHDATSVEITGPGITGSLSLDYDSNEKEWNSWHNGKDVDFSSSPPAPPLTYTFTIVVSSTTIVRTDTVESFVSVYATNLSTSGGETINSPLVFSWTGVGPGYIYMVNLVAEGNWIWQSDDLTVTSVSYDGPALTPGVEYLFVVRVNDEDWNSSSVWESFVYGEKYSVEARSHNWNGERYTVYFQVADPDHEATSVEITGPGITGSLSLDYSNIENNWNSMHNDKLLDFGTSPPTPPLTYTFTIVYPSGTTVKTDTVESFVSVCPTNLSPSGGETITGRLVFSWTGVGPGYGYEVVLIDQEMSYIWDSDDVDENTSASYNGPALISGAKYNYLVQARNEYEDSSIAQESFVYEEWPGSISGTVSYTGASTEPIYVVAFTDPTFNEEKIIAYVVLDSPGSYTITGIADGTYYVASTMATVYDDDIDIKITDPWSLYGTLKNPTPVTITGGSSESGIDITLADVTEENPNPFYEEEEKYSVGASSHNWHYGENYIIDFNVWDPDHEATSVEVAGPGITGSLSLDYDNNEKAWKHGKDKSLDFRSSPPTPPLTYTFTIVDPSGTTIITDTVESFVSVYPTDLSPSGGETISGPLVFSWTGVGPGYEYVVLLNDQEGNRVWGTYYVLTKTSVSYDGPDLTPGAEYSYYLSVRDEYGNSSFLEESFVYQEVGVEEAAQPLVFYLSQNYPNPFNPTTTISYSIPQTDFVQLKVYNVVGELVRTLVREEKSQGKYTAIWDGRNDNGQMVSSGVYIYTLNTGGNNVISKRMLLNK